MARGFGRGTSRSGNPYIKYRPGSKNAEGERAPWVIVQKDTGKELSHHKTRTEAEESFRAMEMSKHE